jgi:hypothetical protein
LRARLTSFSKVIIANYLIYVFMGAL